jgi:hypothetical protein
LVFGPDPRLQDGEEGGEEGDLDAGDGGEAEEAVFDLGDELEVGGFVGAGSAEGDAHEVARWEAGDGCAGGGGVGGEGGGGDEAGIDDVALVDVAVAEEMEEVGGGHGEEALDVERLFHCNVTGSFVWDGGDVRQFSDGVKVIDDQEFC